MPGDLHFSLDIDGERQLSRKLHGLLDRVVDLTPAFQTMAADWSTTMQRKFESEGAHEAGHDAEGNPNPPWAPLSAKYAAWKARHYPGRRIPGGHRRSRIGGADGPSTRRRSRRGPEAGSDGHERHGAGGIRRAF